MAVIIGSPLSDSLSGTDGNDLIYPGGGGDYVVGGAGYDTLMMTWQNFGSVTRSLDAGGHLWLKSSFGTVTLVDMEEGRFVDGTLHLFGADTTEASVMRLYEAVLGRSADIDGLEFWTEQIASGGSLATVAQTFLNSQEFTARNGQVSDDADLVELLYSQVLQRAPDAEGVNYWLNALGTGTTRGSIVAAISDSAEGRALTLESVTLGIWQTNENAALIARIYDTVLNGLPSVEILKDHMELPEISNFGVKLAGNLVALYTQSGIYVPTDAEYIERFYTSALNRQADASEAAYWQAALDAGMSYGELAYNISESAEHVALLAPRIDDGIVIG